LGTLGGVIMHKKESLILHELKTLVNILEQFHKELENLSLGKVGFKEAYSQLDTAIKESEESTRKLIDIINKSLKKLKTISKDLDEVLDHGACKHVIKIIRKDKKDINKLESNLTQSLALFSFQDISSQRILKVKKFLQDLEKSIIRLMIAVGIEDGNLPEEKKREIEKKLEELEWKKEVNQEDVDEILKEMGLE